MTNRKYQELNITNYVDTRIKIGRKSKLQGWAMSDILEQPQARKYIVEEVCSIQE